MHKGNIMKFTEGAFARWGYEVAKEKFGDLTLTEAELWDRYDGRQPAGKVLIKDRIADMLFQQVLLRPDEFSVIATPNLNGDYISDALAAQVGGLGMAPGANIGDRCAVFEATHGTAPKYAGLDKVNPSSLILSGAMMLDHLGWKSAADLVRSALQRTIRKGTVTYDLARQIQGATEVACSRFAEEMVQQMG
jgi:isocitrate dehydrogenase